MDGCTEFIPVTINERYSDVVDVTVHGPIRPFRTTVKQVYQFQKLHDPHKVVVPKFIADLIKELKLAEYTIGEIGACVYDYEEQKWIDDNEELFYRAFLDGYEIEQEQLYEVTVPGTSNYKNQTQQLVKQGKNWFFCGNDVNRFKYRFTKGQIEAAGFGWVFDCNGVKVVEVDE
ncbi:DUF1642 domain-containing protein [Streptococcus suis]|uniref:DUF1642 domain-containing protein n=1 Tax=Streptococcus suis TaxID=1307 RepID=UPI00137975D3|nr:DUF1642 domain-containing protein [Streptococcus suis]